MTAAAGRPAGARDGATGGSIALAFAILELVADEQPVGAERVVTPPEPIEDDRTSHPVQPRVSRVRVPEWHANTVEADPASASGRHEGAARVRAAASSRCLRCSGCWT